MNKKTKTFVFVLIFSNIISYIFSFVLLFLILNLKNKEIKIDNYVSRVAKLHTEFKSTETYSDATAFLFDSSGHLLTNFHTISYQSGSGEFELSNSIYVQFPNEEKTYNAIIVNYDIQKDMAILQCYDFNEEGIHSFAIDSKYGEDCYFIGNTNSVGVSVSKGVISIPSIFVEVDGMIQEYVQSNIDIYPGSSGGCLINKNGEIIGMAAFRLKDKYGNPISGYGYFIPSKVLISFINETNYKEAH